MWGNLTTLTDAINKQVNLGDIQERLVRFNYLLYVWNVRTTQSQETHCAQQGHVTEVGNRLNTLANSVFTFEEQVLVEMHILR